MVQTIDFYEVTSERSKLLLTHSGFEYYEEGSAKSNPGHTFYRCATKAKGADGKRRYCPGRIMVDDVWQTDNDGRRFKRGTHRNNNHNHQPKQGNIEVILNF